ncbi:MAG: hypothetical protein AB2421_16705 [Thermotaleaceae bacterium]
MNISIFSIEMDYFSVFLILVGLGNTVIGLLRRYNKKGLISSDKNIKNQKQEKAYRRYRGLYDAMLGSGFLIAGALNEILRPERYMITMGLTVYLVGVLVVYYIHRKKRGVYM